MTTINHHLTGPILTAYAAGTLPEAFNVIVATHISMCDVCRADLAAADSLGGAILERGDGVALAPDALEACLARLDDNAPEDPAPPAAARDRAGLFPHPLADYVGGGLERVSWRPVGMGVKQAILPTTKEASIRLLYIPAGSELPDHGHRGTELTLVLQGAFRDAEARFGPGDIEVCDDSVKHMPVAEPGVDCICVAATEAPLKFTGLLPRMAQPFLRI